MPILLHRNFTKNLEDSFFITLPVVLATFFGAFGVIVSGFLFAADCCAISLRADLGSMFSTRFLRYLKTMAQAPINMSNHAIPPVVPSVSSGICSFQVLPLSREYSHTFSLGVTRYLQKSGSLHNTATRSLI